MALDNETTAEILGLAELQREKRSQDEPTLSDLLVVPRVPRRVAQRPSEGPTRHRTAPRHNWLLYGAVVAACGFLGWAGATILTSPVKGPVSAATPAWPQHPTPSLTGAPSPRQSPPAHHYAPAAPRTHAHPRPTHHVTPHPTPSHTVTKPKPSPTVSSPGSHQPSPAPSSKPTHTHQPPSTPPSPTATASDTAKPPTSGQSGTPSGGTPVSHPGENRTPSHPA